MARSIDHLQRRASSTRYMLWILGATSILIFLATSWHPSLSFIQSKSPCPRARVGTGRESKDPTFYDNPTTTYTIDEPMTEWDAKRSHWLKLHPSFEPSDNRVLVVTGSQPPPCSNPGGDHLLLRFFKNKVDYCRIHGYDIFYNNAFLHEKQRSRWAKLTALRAAMVAHPEVEWLFWVDSDAVFTDMDFEVPLNRYEEHNMVVHGWPEMIYVNRSWVSVNSGVFLLRNCGWSMELLDVWAGMGPMSPNYKRWGQVLKAALKGNVPPDSDDQSALVYQILEGKRKWREKIYVESEYALHGYWVKIVDRYDELRRKYGEMEMEEGMLGRRHAEAEWAGYAAERGRRAEEGGWRRPFVTHFTGCQPCSGEQSPEYEGNTCRVGIERALNFADDQVLRNYGFVRPDLGDSSPVEPLPFRPA